MGYSKPLSDETLREVVEAYARNHNNRAATARELDLSPSTVFDRLAMAARRGIAPEAGLDHNIPIGFSADALSRCVRTAAGEMMWIKMSREKATKDDNILEAIQERVDRIKPIAPIKVPRSTGPEDHLAVYPIFDGHIGAMAWDKETGHGNWDLQIAEDTMLTGMAWLMEYNTPAQDAVVLIGGDFTETDGYNAVTPTSGHLLDADGRYPKIFEVAERVIENSVIFALRKHRHVTLSIRRGNHDPQTAFALRRVMMRVFAGNPRVTVDENIREYWAMLFGKTMIACHHGDKAKLEQLPMIFAADFAEMWGKATFRVCHSGHWHHQKTLNSTGQEKTGMMMEQHPTVERANAWAAGKGLIAARALCAHTYHINGGVVNKLYFNPDIVMKEAA